MTSDARPRRLPPRRLVPVLAVLILVGSGLCLFLALTKPDRSADPPGPPGSEDGRYRPADLAGPAGPALRAATTTLPLALTYDYRDLAGSRRAATADMTASFGRRFATAFDRAAAPFVKRKEVTDAVVNAAGVVRVVRAGSGARRRVRVRCLVVVDQRLLQSTADAGSIAPRVVSRSRVLVDVVLRDGTWKVGGIARMPGTGQP